jgi:signal transduction histidine kinase
MRTSIQRRLFVILGLFVLANAVLWSGLALLLAYIVEDEIIDRVLASQIQLIIESHATTGQLPNPALPELSLYASKGEAPEHLMQHVTAGQRGGEIFTADQSHYHYRWIALPGRAPALLVAQVSPWLVVTHISTALLTLALAGLAVGTALGLVAVAQIARITTRPLRELTAAIQSDPRPSPLPNVSDRDEVGILAASMTTALANLQQALAREQAFTRDVSHELRTPMTTLKNALQLMPQECRRDPHARDLAKSSAELEKTLATLLALARAESADLEPLQLRPLLEKLLLERADVLQARDFDVSLEVPDDCLGRGSLQITRLLLGNLLDNALHYAEPARLRIWAEGGQLCLENPQSAVGTRPHDHSLRHGLGLAQRLSAAQSWQLVTEGQGDTFCARLHLQQ